MDTNSETYRLIELMPASGRMYCKIISDASQPRVMAVKLPRPGQEVRPIRINFELWQQLTQPYRDLLLLRAVTWLTGVQWFKLDLYQGLTAVGLLATLLELLQMNPSGMVAMSGLTALAGAQIWRKNRSSQVEMVADEKAVQVAQRRGYTQESARRSLGEAIEAVAQIEKRDLTFNEVLRCQNLRAAAVPTSANASATLTQE